MHLYIFIIVFLLILLLIPIPLKIKINYKDNKRLDFYIYNIKIDRNVSFVRKKTQSRIKYRVDQVPIIINSLRNALKSLKDIKFKPKLKININLTCGLGDAAYTALTYALISMVCPLLFQFLSLIFKLKDANFKIQPEYNKYILKLEITSIISVNLVKVIYIFILVYINLRKDQKMNLANT